MKTKVEIELVPRNLDEFNVRMSTAGLTKQTYHQDLENIYYISDENITTISIKAIENGFNAFAILTPTYLYLIYFQGTSKIQISFMRSDFYAINNITTVVKEED